jgi:hypothetical protein
MDKESMKYVEEYLKSHNKGIIEAALLTANKKSLT